MKKPAHTPRGVRITCAAVFAALLFTEIMIGLYAQGWVRSYLGDVLVVPLVYCMVRAVSPVKPRYGAILPTAVLLFAYAVEFLQLFEIADRLGITNTVLRIIIGTSFSWGDILCYTIGIIPAYIYEIKCITMSTREQVHKPVDRSSEEQLRAFLVLFDRSGNTDNDAPERKRIPCEEMKSLIKPADIPDEKEALTECRKDKYGS